MLGCDKEDPQGFIAAQFLHKSFDYRQHAVTFYTDGSKEPAILTMRDFSPNLNINIAHKFPAETSIFFAELWAI